MHKSMSRLIAVSATFFTLACWNSTFGFADTYPAPQSNETISVETVRALPNEERQAWLSQLHQQSSDESGASGGAAIANYNDLIRLIEESIDADWQANGGTATLRPFRQGVRIDPKGVIERFEDKKERPLGIQLPKPSRDNAAETTVSLEKLGAWQQPTALRWISLHQLDQQLDERIDEVSPRRASIAMELLAGLYRIDYVACDKETQEWFLGGPAGHLVSDKQGDLYNPESGLPPVLLEDLLSVAPHVLNGHGELGCSIDPDPTRLNEAYAMARTPSFLKKLQRDPEGWADEWRRTLGRQHARVAGLRQDSPTGFALLVADAHMKRLGLGLEACPTGMKSYWTERDLLSSTFQTDAGLVRWWFSTTKHKIPMDPDSLIYHFASSNVQVLSEAQMLNALGQQVTAHLPDVAADAFARNFTRNFEQLQRDYRVYGRLRHIFDLSIAMEIVRQEIERGNGKPLKALTRREIQPRLPTMPLELESVAATHRTPNGSMSAMISGGVSIQAQHLKKRIRVDRSLANQVAIGSARDLNPDIAFEGEAASKTDDSSKPKLDSMFWR